jgi:UDP-N-acetylglucosamine--N-acetylmuramyl-(pentapeptide) pyrophosphoryl-undecaprenol N-acetylglucosamine transferase
MSPLRFILAGGGTSGHINPALAIADQIRLEHPDAEILFCGTSRGLEQTMVPRAGYDFRAIRARGLPRRPSIEMLRALADFFAGRRQCRQILREFKPDAIIGTGGYVCSPLVAAATSLKVPVLLHEQNAFPGRSNRLMARNSQMVCISFPGSEEWFRTKSPIVLTGNPVRPEFFKLTRQAARKTWRSAAAWVPAASMKRSSACRPSRLSRPYWLKPVRRGSCLLPARKITRP